jgi:hypothetical protein
VEQAKEGATLKAKMEKLLPALVVGLTTRASERVAFHLVKELLDTLEPHLDPDTFVFDDDSLRNASSEAIVGEALVEGLKVLSERQATAADQREEKKKKEPEAVFNKARKGLRGAYSALRREFKQLEDPGFIAPLEGALSGIEAALAQRRFDLVLDDIESALNEVNRLAELNIVELKTETMTRIYEQVRAQLARMHGAIESVHGSSMSDELESGVFDRVQMGGQVPMMGAQQLH